MSGVGVKQHFKCKTKQFCPAARKLYSCMMMYHNSGWLHDDVQQFSLCFYHGNG